MSRERFGDVMSLSQRVLMLDAQIPDREPPYRMPWTWLAVCALVAWEAFR